MANGNGNGVLAFLNRWKVLVGALVGLGVWLGALEADSREQWTEINRRVPTDSFALFRQDMKHIKTTLDEVNARQREIFCTGQPPGCR